MTYLLTKLHAACKERKWRLEQLVFLSLQISFTSHESDAQHMNICFGELNVGVVLDRPLNTILAALCGNAVTIHVHI